MGFTPISVQAHRFNPDGSVATGTITFTPNATMENDIDVIEPVGITAAIAAPATLLGLPSFELTLFAVDDDGTSPSGPTAAYAVTEKITGIRSPAVYDVYILHDATIIDEAASFSATSPIVTLSNVKVTQSMIGQTFSGDTQMIGATVLSINVGANTLTTNVNAASTIVEAAEIGGAVDLSTLTTYSPAPSVGTYIPYNLGQTDGQVPTWDADEGAWVPETPGGGSGTIKDAIYGLQVFCNTDSVLGDLGQDSLNVEKYTVWDNTGNAYDQRRIQSVPLLVPAGGIVVAGITGSDDLYASISLFDATNFGGVVGVQITVADLTGTNRILTLAQTSSSASGPDANLTLDWTTAEVLGSFGDDLSLTDMYQNIISAGGGLYIVTVDYAFGYAD